MIRIIDVSLYQDSPQISGHIDFAKMRASGAVGVIIKAGQNVWVDPLFHRNYDAAEASGLLVGTYWYMDWNALAANQAAAYIDVLSTHPTDITPVVDYECRYNAPDGGKALSRLLQFIVPLERATQRVPMIYTSPSYWREYGSPERIYSRYPLWIANYQVVKPMVPAPWIDYDLWQWTDRDDGYKFGVESKQVDCSWFDGTEAEFRAWCGAAEDIPQPQEPDKPRYRVTAYYLNVRSEPHVDADNILRKLEMGDQVTVYEVGNGWGRIGENEWVSMRHLDAE